MSDEMIILTRTFDLLTWLVPKTNDFPKSHRSTVTQRMMEVALYFQEALFDAHSFSGRTRLTYLLTADAHLNKLRLYLRLAYHWQWLNDGQYRHVSALVAEIGRLLGGWIKTTQATNPKK